MWIRGNSDDIHMHKISWFHLYPERDNFPTEQCSWLMELNLWSDNSILHEVDVVVYLWTCLTFIFSNTFLNKVDDAVITHTSNPFDIQVFLMFKSRCVSPSDQQCRLFFLGMCLYSSLTNYWSMKLSTVSPGNSQVIGQKSCGAN